MTVTTVDRGNTDLARAALDRDALAEAAGDGALVAVLRGKPTQDQVPAAVWWLVAEALRTSVTVRRTALRPQGSREDRAMLHREAALLTDAALEELADATGARPSPTLVEPMTNPNPVAVLQRSILRLARLLVTQRATAARVLADALAEHHRALALIRAGTSSQVE